jgi:hypothetical protein
MIYTKEELKQLRELGKSGNGKFILNILEKAKDSIADCRYSPKVYNQDSRILAVKALDEFLINPLKRGDIKSKTPADDWD